MTTPAPVPFVLFQITNIDDQPPLQVAISDAVLDSVVRACAHEGVMRTSEDIAFAAISAVRGDGDVFESLNAATLGLLGQGRPVGVADTLVGGGYESGLGAYVADSFAFGAEGDELSAMARELGRGRAVVGCAIFRPGEEEGFKHGREIRRVVDLDAARYVAAKVAKGAKA